MPPRIVGDRPVVIDHGPTEAEPAPAAAAPAPQPIGDEYSGVTATNGSTPPTAAPMSGAFGAGRPKRGTAGPLAVRASRDAFFSLHGADANQSRRIFANAEFLRPGQGQSWTALVAQHYGDDVPPETMALVIGTLQHLNGRSSLEAPPEVVALPPVADLERMLRSRHRRLTSDCDRGAQTPPTGLCARAQEFGDGATVSELPTVGHTYRPGDNDTLRGVALHAYASQLEGLSPEQADHRLQVMMLTLAYVNEMRTHEMGGMGEVYVPTYEQMGQMVTRFEAEPQMLTAFQDMNSALWATIERTGISAARDVSYLAQHSVTASIPRSQLATQLALAGQQFTVARVSRMMTVTPGFNVFGMFASGVVQELAGAAERPPGPGELPLRREGETFAAYLDRVHPDVSPEEYRQILGHPTRLLMLEAGLINGNGEVDQSRREQFESSMRALGLVSGTDGSWSVEPRQGETLQTATDRLTRQAMTRVGIPFEFEAGQSLEQTLASVPADLTPAQQRTLRQLVIWNQVVLLSSEPRHDVETGEPTASVDPSAPATGSTSALFNPAQQGYTAFCRTGHPCQSQLDALFVDVAAMPVAADAVGEARDEADGDVEESAVAQAAAGADRARRQTGKIDALEQSKRQARRSDAVEVEAERVVAAFTDEQVESRRDVNEQLADGENPGGSGRNDLA